MKERSLVAFTLLLQAAVGSFWVLGLLYIWIAYQAGTANASLLVDKTLLALGPLVFLGLLASVFHLGTPVNAWRSLANLRSSWLSREILFATSFAGLGAFVAALQWFKLGPVAFRFLFAGITVLCGFALVYCMARVYMLRTVAPWNTRLTLLYFGISSLLLGVLVSESGLLLTYARLPVVAKRVFWLSRVSVPAARIWMVLCIVLLLVVQLLIFTLGLMRLSVQDLGKRAGVSGWQIGLRIGLATIGGCLAVFAVYPAAPLVASPETQAGMALLALVLVSAAEIVGRILFYKMRQGNEL